MIIYSEKNARQDLPNYSQRSHKGDHGRVLIVAGSNKYPGAGILAASSASRVGAGFVTLGNFENSYGHWLESPEFLIESFERLDFKKIKKYNSIAVGPGLGVSIKLKNFLKSLIHWKIKNVILDADALNTCAKYKLFPLPKTWIMTPHSQELSRLLNVDVQKIDKNRTLYIQKVVNKYGCCCLLKGTGTLISQGKTIFKISSGNASLSKAGSGDVLTGMIAGVQAQGKSSLKAALLGAFLHGFMADQWIAKGNDMISLMPSDLRESLPKLIRTLRL